VHTDRGRRWNFPERDVVRVVQARPVTWEPVETGGYSVVSAHWRVVLANGHTVFVKHALTRDAADSLRRERRLYEAVRGSFIPAFIGACDNGTTTLLVLEDLTEAEWPPPWSSARIDAVLGSLDALHKTRPPSGLDSLEAMRASVVGWGSVAADPEPLLGTGICSRAWLEDALGALVRAGEAAQLGGGDLLHFDVRSDNLCFVSGRAVLVDWNLACKGNGRFDVAFWLPSLSLEAALIRGRCCRMRALSPPRSLVSLQRGLAYRRRPVRRPCVSSSGHRPQSRCRGRPRNSASRRFRRCGQCSDRRAKQGSASRSRAGSSRWQELGRGRGTGTRLRDAADLPIRESDGA
jgi:hypothetical protein